MKAIIKQIIKETKIVNRYFLEVPEVQTFQFLPGQFVVVTIPGLPADANERSYSIANAPDGSNNIELCIVLKPDGAATPWFWGLEIGDQLEISEAKGNFVLPPMIETDIAFICTGTGVAPFRSMLVHLLKKQQAVKPIYLIFGNRFAEDILYKDELLELEKMHPNFHFIPVLSRELEWAGEKGYVHSVYERIFADKRDAKFLICGWNAMCIEARERLKSLGYNRKQYLFEDYG